MPLSHQVVTTEKLYVWPDHSWCWASEYSAVNDSWRGDDFAQLDFPVVQGEEVDLEDFIDHAMSGGGASDLAFVPGMGVVLNTSFRDSQYPLLRSLLNNH